MIAGRIAFKLPTFRRTPDWPALVLGTMALKPLADVFSPRTLETGVDLGSMVALIPLLLLLPWALIRRKAALSSWLIWLGVIGLMAYATVHALALSGTAGLLEGAKVATGLAPAVIVLDPHLRAQGLTVWRRVLPLLLVGLGVHVMAAWLQFAGLLATTYTQFGRGRPSGMFHHPVQLGFLLVGAVLAVAILHLHGRLGTAKALALAGVFSLTVVISTHRTSLLVLLLVLMAWGLTALLRRVSLSRQQVGWGALAACGLMIAALLTFPLWQAPAQQALTGVVGVIQFADLDPSDDGFLRGRGQRWNAVLEQMRHGGTRGWLFGYGYQVVDPHTDYLRLPQVHGLLGSALLLLCLGWLALTALRSADGLGRLWILVALGAMAVYAITTKPTSYPSFMWAWILVMWLGQAAVDRTGDGARR